MTDTVMSDTKTIKTEPTDNTTTSTVTDTTKQPRIKVKKWNAVAFWSYDIENDTCAICHNALMVPCIACEAEPHQIDECSVAWGTCGHSYHFHCITKWLRTRSTCPLDDDEWDFVQY